jgi:amidase
MAFRTPTADELLAAAVEIDLDLKADDVDAYLDLAKGFLAGHRIVDALPDGVSGPRAARAPGRRPSPEENPLGAWVTKTSVKEYDDGPLAGRTVVLKDNVALAGHPMGGGTGFLADYVPEVDATLVDRILEAGGEIVGKAACEYLSFSGGSHTSATGPVHNPRRHGHSAGGSSSGSAALVAAGEVDMAIGCDQGGSIRTPAAFCGVVGMKPSFGLVPYSGILSIETSVDHAGPITANVRDNALLLEVIAGPDGLDPRQNALELQDYVDALTGAAAGLRIGVLEDGFGLANSDPAVDARVRAAAAALRKLGAKVESVSMPMHAVGSALVMPIFAQGATDLMFSNGVAVQTAGLFLPGLPEAFARWRDHTDELSEMVKALLLVGRMLARGDGPRLYARAQNQRRVLRASYDRILESHDLLLMPTLPITARPLPPPDAPREDVIRCATEMMGNTAQFDLTGHPALSVPCGEVDGLPVGMMLVGRHFDEGTLYRAAHAYEQSVA